MAHPDLVAHSAQFEKSIVELAPGAWTAVGFAASNVHMIEGDETVTIVDTTESTAAAENIFVEFRRLSDKPVGRIVYTHSHRDHISGATVFSRAGSVPIIASASFSSDLVEVDEERILPQAALVRRTQAQFGIGLSPKERISLGCGPGDRPTEGLGAGFLEPTERIDADVAIDLDGVEAHLILSPGETSDHMALWMPESRVLIPGDNWYHAFPNLYAIRGTPYRDFGAWADTLGRLADLGAEVLSPGHTMPVFGQQAVRDVLTTTREAILYVMQETSRGMDRGLAIDDIVAELKLPSDLANKPWLGEFYGKLAWSARAFAAGTLGWYDGNPTHLGTLPSKTRAAHLAALAGGTDRMMRAAQETGDLQWRLELCDHLISLGEPAEVLKAETMTALAETEINATARNAYLWESKRLRQGAGA